MTSSSGQPPAGWYPDPAGSGGERFWDGAGWSQGTRPGVEPDPVTVAPQNPALALAGWWRRVGASLIDGLVLGVPVTWLTNLILGDPYSEVVAFFTDMWNTAMAGGTPPTELPAHLVNQVNLMSLISLVCWVLYRTILVATSGGTVGQHAVGVRVVAAADPAGSNVPWGTSTLRAIGAVLLQQVPIVNLVDVLLPLMTAKKQTIHDMIAKTVVVQKTGKSDIVHSA